MNELKKIMRRSGRTSGLILLSHQFLFQLLSFILMAIPLILAAVMEYTMPDNSLMYVASDIAMLISGIIFLIFYFVNRKSLREQSPEKSPFSLAAFAGCIIIILGVNCFLTAADTLLNRTTGFSLSFPSDSAADVSPLVLFLAVGVFPAIVEELIFRGILYRYLRRHGCAFAAFASSLLFGLIHLNVLQAIFAFALGLVLCYAYERSGRLIFPMILHFLNNSLMVVLTVIPVDSSIISMCECTAGVIALAAGLIYVLVMKLRRKKIVAVSDGEFSGKCLYFFTSIPMMILVILCFAVCIAVIFI